MILPRIAAAFLIGMLPGNIWAQDVILHPDPAASLTQRWGWATTESRDVCTHGCWIGYSIQRMMEVNSYSGWYSSHRTQHPTLQMLVYGREVEPTPAATEERRVTEIHDREGASRRVLKEVALLFRFASGGQSLRDVRISNISLPAELDELPLVWLGPADQPESLELLKEQYARAPITEQKEELVGAVGMHDAVELVVPFLREVLASKENNEVREQAVFWLAETQDPDILPLLERTARGDTSEDVREQAVFGISRIETEAADELLISLARNLDDRETREQAIFWLGQKASKKAAANLEDIAENDPDVEIQKKAVFAISELPDDDGIPRLISIARNHRNAKVRHEAIFWLGESGDPRAVDVLVQIVRGR